MVIISVPHLKKHLVVEALNNDEGMLIIGNLGIMGYVVAGARSYKEACKKLKEEQKKRVGAAE